MQLKVYAVLGLILFTFFITCRSDRPVKLKTKLQIDSIQQMESIRIAYRQHLETLEDEWVEAQLSSLSPDSKLGQLFMLGAYPKNGESDEKKVLESIEKEQIGGLIFFRGTEMQIARLTNLYQKKSSVPLMMAIDAEWGLNMRVSNAVKFPRQLTLGAIQDNELIYAFGSAVAKECKAVGIHINFAPVVDVNNNPANPVIGNRSFGESRENVSEKALQYINGLQDNGIMACAKHFPGHGDTDVDSHKDLPVILHDMARLDSIELYPFRMLAKKGVQSVMVAHLQIPALDSSEHVPITLSKPAVTGLLQEQLGFKGLIFTDALNMKGVTKHFEDGETDLLAFLAGNDILLVTQDIPKAKQKIKQAINEGLTSWDEVDRRVRKILHAKYKMGLNNYKAVNLENVKENLNVDEHAALKEKLVENAITLVDEKSVFPLQPSKTAFVHIGSDNSFCDALKQYQFNTHFFLNKIEAEDINELANYEHVVIVFHKMSDDHKAQFGIGPSMNIALEQLSKKCKTSVVLFGSPYALKYLDAADAAVVAYNKETLTKKITADCIAGARTFKGKLPVSAGQKYRYGMGKNLNATKMIKVSAPEDLGMDSKILSRIDAIAEEMISSQAAPGCQVLVAKDGKIAFHKAYGHYTYDKKQAVRLDNIYDLASVTKVAATTLSIMKLYEEGKIDIQQPLSLYVPELIGTNKSRITIRDILIHKAGLKPWIPFYTRTLNELNQPVFGEFYSKEADDSYNVRITENMYFKRELTDSILWQRIYDNSLRSKTDYKYSDLGFYLFKKLIKNVTGMELDEYAQQHFYEPMGLKTTMFNPMSKGIDKEDIIPTEEDNYFRYQKIQGDVHDMGAAMIDGVSGHAGLFSDARDLAVIYQMLIDGGSYGGKNYLKKSTIDKFIAQYHKDSRRGLGFDRKEVSDEPNKSINVAYQASDRTFGHQGFTGIGAWGDPENKIVYLFLSNRTYPSGENMTLIRKDIRSRIQEVVYESIIK